ncbi:MAG: hypothetical protein LQ350_004835 [Teloschistes chrysophthalmus]|nr:MAG: hypothetical protein LQ350_004835 [Niorma chrysophthalma]
MSEQRKPTTRYQGERPPKRRQLSLTPQTPPPSKAPSRKEINLVPKDELPGKVKEGSSLPVLPEKQSSSLPDADFQSIAESGVLAASIQQSRQRCADGFFERYWIKPSKKKGIAEGSNPAKETMVKIGTCSMIIEPHVFETTLYTVRELSPVFLPAQATPISPSARVYNPYQDHKTYQQPIHNPYNRASHLPYHQTNYPHIPSSSLTLPPFREGFGQFSPAGPPQYTAPVAPRPIVSSQSSEHVPLSSPPSDNTIMGENDKVADPVIQMLATRAAADHNLKALMKIVASGHAAQGQLEEFQGHINDLNRLVKSRGGWDQPNVNDQPPPPHTQLPAVTQTYRPTPTQSTSQEPAVTVSATPYATPKAEPKPIKAESPGQSQYFSHIAQSSRPKPPMVASYKSDIVSMVFDFTPNGDRFLFPRFSILEFLPGGMQVLASFLVIRKGSEAMTPGEYNKTTTYYQPVTLRLSAPFARMLEPLARVVAPPDEVKKYMNGIFDKMNRAKPAFLAVRLPKAKVEEDEDMEMKEAPVVAAPGSLIKRRYSPPNGMVPLAA